METESALHFSNWLKNKIIERELTATEVARLSGVSQSAMFGYVNKQHETSLFAACCISRALGYSLVLVKTDDIE